MKKFEITKKQVMQLAKNNKENKEQLVDADLRNWFPDVFKTKFTGWAKDIHEMNEDWIAYYENDIFKYGINANGDWFKSKSNANYNECESNRVATEQEVSTALINEAKKRGFVMGCTWNSSVFTAFAGYSFYYNFKYNSLTLQGATIFKNGIWKVVDEVLETITKEDAEKLLNKKII